MSSEPLKDIRGSKGHELEDLRIVLCVTGSVAAIESVELARELIRHGAEVYPVMTDSARRIIHPNILEWATGNPPVTKLTGRTEHIQLAGRWDGKADLILIAPSTANTIGKIASGIDDTAVTAVATTGIGSGIPMLIALGMHQPMYDNPVVAENVRKLEDFGISFINPKIEEGKAKMAPVKQIVDTTIKTLSKGELSGKKVVVTAGPTVEYIDPVRVISNKSSGKMGVALAVEARRRGAEITLIHGPGVNSRRMGFKVVSVETTKDLQKTVVSHLKTDGCDIFIAAGAPADFSPVKSLRKKIGTRGLSILEVKLKSTPKVVNEIKKIASKAFLVVFRAEHNVSKNSLVNGARLILKESGGDLAVANDVGKRNIGFGSDMNEVLVLDKNGVVTHIPLASKQEVASKIFDMIVKRLK